MTTVDIGIHGTCAAGFEPVRKAFEASFTEHGDVGASLSLVVDGETVVDLWGGHADPARTRPWEANTIVNVYSTTKGITAIGAAMLVDRGQLDVEAPVASYWPEFEQAGKGAIPVKWLLSHLAGLPAVDAALPPGGAFDWDVMTNALAVQAPYWQPGEEMGYHAVTYGWLVGEVMRRITGKSVGAFVRDEIAGPLGVDFLIGTPASEDHRIAEMIPAAPGQPIVANPDPVAQKAFAFIAPPVGAGVNTREWRAAELPAANGHGNARSLARMYGALARGGELGGVRLLSESAIGDASAPQAKMHDRVLNMEVTRSLGFINSMKGGRYEWGPGARTFGHSGAGGSLAFADPDAKLGFGYAMNQMSAGLGADPRWNPLIDAAYGCL